MSFVHVVRGALKKLRYPDVDSAGNLLASVTPRTDTLANLLLITDAGDGEVATATDESATVVYKGSPISVGKPYFRNGCDLLANATLAGTAFPAGVVTPLSLTIGASSPSNLVDETNDVILMPSHLQNLSVNEVCLIDLTYSLICFGLDASIATEIRAELYDSALSTWELISNLSYNETSNASGILESKGFFIQQYSAGKIKNISKARITFKQNSVAAAGTIFTSYLTAKAQIF